MAWTLNVGTFELVIFIRAVGRTITAPVQGNARAVLAPVLFDGAVLRGWENLRRRLFN